MKYYVMSNSKIKRHLALLHQISMALTIIRGCKPSKDPLRLLLFLIIIAFAYPGLGGAVRPGFNSTVVEANDDESYPTAVNIGYSLNFFGTSYSQLYVNNNGNVTFGNPLSAYTPSPIGSLGVPMIAPYWADVDTRGTGSGLTKFGSGSVDGHQAFGVTWVNVGYFDFQTDKLCSFQVVLISRSDLGQGCFDIEFNYDKVQWETGDASGGSGGLGGNSARVGYSNGQGTAFEMAGSGVNGAFLDSSPSGLIHSKLNSDQLGRYVFRSCQGEIAPSLSLVGADCNLDCSADSHFINNQFAFIINGSSGNPCTVKASTDLIVWSQIGTVNLNGSPACFTDTQAGSYQQRFYRVVCGNVCSANTIGFQKIAAVPQMTMIANQLNAPCGNTVGVLFPTPPDGTQLSKWDGQQYVANQYEFGAWSLPNMTLNPGEGAFFKNNTTSSYEIRFIGEVQQGTLVNPIPGGPNGSLSIRSSMVPQAGLLQTQLGYSPTFGDTIYRWNVTQQQYESYVSADGAWLGSEPNVSVGESFFISTDTTKNWIRTFIISCP